MVAGGELTLDMLDLRYDSTGHYYDPLHMKALGGCFFIDDFGRQFDKSADECSSGKSGDKSVISENDTSL